MDGFTVWGDALSINGTLTPPSFIIGSPYSYNNTFQATNITGVAGTEVNINVSTTTILDGVEIWSTTGILENVSIISTYIITVGSSTSGNITLYTPTKPSFMINNTIQYPEGTIWSFDSSTNITTITGTTYLVTIVWNLNPTYSPYGAAFYDNVDHYPMGSFYVASTTNLQQPWAAYDSTSCFSTNVVYYNDIPNITSITFPNGIGLISDANNVACQGVSGRAMANLKLNSTSSVITSITFNYTSLVPTGINGTYTFQVAYTTSNPTTVGTIIYTQNISSTTNGTETVYITNLGTQIFYLQFVLYASPDVDSYTDGCSFSTFSDGACIVIDEIYVSNAGGYIYPHNLNVAWAMNGAWFNVVQYPTIIQVDFPASPAVTDNMYIPVPTPDRQLPITYANLITVYISSTEAPGYFRTIIPTGLATGNQTIHIDDPSLVNQIVFQINDLTSKFPIGSEIYLTRSNYPLISGYMGEGNLFTAWLTPAIYTFTIISGSNTYISTVNVPATSATIVVYIAISDISTPANVGQSISYSAIWNEATNNTVQVTYEDLTTGTTSMTFYLYEKNSTCATGCLVSSVASGAGSYGSYTDQLPANYSHINGYYVKITSVSTPFGTNTFGPIYLGKYNIPIGHIVPPSMVGLGFTPYFSSWVTIFDLISFFVIVTTAGLFTKKDSSIAMIAIAVEGAFFTSISVFATGEITWTHITPGIFAIIGVLGVFTYMRQKESVR